MKRYIETHAPIDLGFDVKRIFSVDIQKLQNGVVITTLAQRDGNRSKPLKSIIILSINYIV